MSLSSKSPIKARFGMRSQLDGSLIDASEEELATHLPEVANHLHLDDADAMGYLKLELEDIAYEIAIHDSLSFLIQQFCFESVPAILREETSCYAYTYAENDKICVFMRARSGIALLFGYESGIPDIYCPMENLLTAVYSAGLRYLELIERLREKRGAGNVDVERIKRSAENARNAFNAHNIKVE